VKAAQAHSALLAATALAAALVTTALSTTAPTGTAPAGGQAADSAVARPRLVRLLGIEGVPADSAIGGEFQLGFQEVLATSSLALEQRDASGEWRAAGSRESRFRFTDDPQADDAWTILVVVRMPPPFSASRRNPHTNKTERYVDPSLRASRGMTAALLISSPQAVATGAHPEPAHVAFAFPQSVAPANVVGSAPGGFKFPWRQAGRTTALLAIELLHHRSGDLAETLRCDLSPALRADSDR
jgi:hypothetical protein